MLLQPGAHNAPDESGAGGEQVAADPAAQDADGTGAHDAYHAPCGNQAFPDPPQGFNRAGQMGKEDQSRVAAEGKTGDHAPNQKDENAENSALLPAGLNSLSCLCRRVHCFVIPSDPAVSLNRKNTIIRVRPIPDGRKYIAAVSVLQPR
jgi:hypothetical protein